MNNKNNESTMIFLLCVGLYLIIGIIAKFTTWMKGPLRWYHVIIIVPMGILGLIMQIYPYDYIKTKLKKWGMFEDKADRVAFGLWIGCMLIWYFTFISGSFSDD